MSDDIVTYLMPDGSKVSNDPRWQAEEGAAAMEALLEATPNTGHAGIPDNEMQAQIGGGMAPLQSGQPGVGDNATVEDPDKTFGTTRATLTQREDAKEAAAAGNTPTSPGVEPDEPVDSNQAVLDAREAEQKRQEAEAEAMAALAEKGQDPGDPNKPYSEWTAAQLKAELKVVNAQREADGQDPLDTSGVKNKSQLAEALQANRDNPTA